VDHVRLEAARGNVTMGDGRLTGTLPGVPCGQMADLLLVDVGDIAIVAIGQPGVNVEFENTRFRLAELSAEITSATTYVDDCLTTRVHGGLAAADAAAARLITTALNDRAVDQSMQLHGGYGYMREYPIAQAFADARFLRLVGQAHSDPRHALAEDLGL